MKACRDCGETKPFTDFYKQENCKDGRQPTCIACKLEYGRLWRSQKSIGDELVSRMLQGWQR